MKDSVNGGFTNEQLAIISRDGFVDTFDQAADPSRGNPFDPNGIVRQIVLRGEPKSRILEALLCYREFYRRYHCAKLPASLGIPRDELFGEILDYLDSITDFEPPLDWREVAVRNISKFDPENCVVNEIRQGATSARTLELLKNSASWRERFHDYDTRDDVELPQFHQEKRWHEFQGILTSINDLDEIDLDEPDFFRYFFDPVEIVVNESSITWAPGSTVLTANYGPNCEQIIQTIHDSIWSLGIPGDSFGVSPTGPHLTVSTEDLWTVFWIVSGTYSHCSITFVGPDYPSLEEMGLGEDDGGNELVY